MEVGYVGLGSMGGGIVKRMLHNKQKLRVYDLSPERTAEMAALGGQPSQSLAALASESDVVCLCLPTSENVRTAIFGENGLAKGLKPGAIVADMTTGDPLQTKAMAAELEALLVPSFCLQPLVENAIRHGPGARPEGGAIRVTGRRHGPSLELAVTDDGPGLAAAGAPGCGTGIANTRLRLRALHGDQAQLRLERPADGGCRAVITLPATPEAAPAMAAAPS